MGLVYTKLDCEDFFLFADSIYKHLGLLLINTKRMQTKYLLLIKNRNFLPIPWRKLWNFIYIALQGWRKLFDMGCAICFWGHKKSCKLRFLKILGSQVENFRLCCVSNSFSGWKDRCPCEVENLVIQSFH